MVSWMRLTRGKRSRLEVERLEVERLEVEG